MLLHITSHLPASLYGEVGALEVSAPLKVSCCLTGSESARRRGEPTGDDLLSCIASLSLSRRGVNMDWREREREEGVNMNVAQNFYILYMYIQLN